MDTLYIHTRWFVCRQEICLFKCSLTHLLHRFYIALTHEQEDPRYLNFPWETSEILRKFKQENFKNLKIEDKPKFLLKYIMKTMEILVIFVNGESFCKIAEF